MKYLLSIDPGKSTGITLWSYSDSEPAARIGAWQFPWGSVGLREWVNLRLDKSGPWYWEFPVKNDVPLRDVSYVCEKFTPLQGKGFSLTMDAVEPLVCEGVLIGLDVMPPYEQGVEQDCWQRPASMYFCGGSTKPEKLKRSRAWLETKGLLLTGKDVGCRDADDAISSTLHALAWFRKMKHGPTLAHYWKDGE